MKKSCFVYFAIFALAAGLVAQTRAPGATLDRTAPAAQSAAAGRTEGTGDWNAEAEERLQLAISSIDYPVTPGDIYQLTYRESAGTILQRQFQVDGVSVVDMGVFGRIDAAGMTFFDLKQRVEEMIARNYTYSQPSFSILSPGVFRVAVRDGTSRVYYETAWGLTRLSEIVARVESSGFSLRNVERVSRNGRSERFDLLKAAISEQESADPFVRSGDMVILHSAERIVELRGEVRRPGRFELLDGENFQDLVDIFGGGFSSRADTERLRLHRTSETGEFTEYLNVEKLMNEDAELRDGDIIEIGDKTTRRAFVWFVGAVSAPFEVNALTGAAAAPGTGAAAGAAAGAAERQIRNGRFAHDIREGVKLSDVLQDIRPYILSTANLGAALLTQPDNSQSKSMDLQPLLAGTDLSKDIVVPPGSVIFIPELRSTISVSGAVILPGLVAYHPGAPAEYYLGLCGGINPERNTNGDLTVYDSYGKQRSKDDPIMPGDSIFVKNNSFGYNLERTVSIWLPIISMVITLTTFGMTVVAP